MILIMATFQRAHSEEQRAVRRQAILQTTAAMLAEMPVAAISLNELSRRVGLAKSNVLRYFDSREAILLSLLSSESADLLAELTDRLSRAPDRRRSLRRRTEHVADAIVEALSDRPVLCDLVSAQAAVLERNISDQVAATFKLASIEQLRRGAELVHRQLPELSLEDCTRLVAMTFLQVGTIWAHSQPAPAVEQVYSQHPEVAAFRVDFRRTTRELIITYAAGLSALAQSK
jgi:AcrR family transcriptional regulator